MEILNIFIISIILAIVCNVNNEILITSGQYVPAPRYVASSEIIGNRFYVIGGQVSITGTVFGGVILDVNTNSYITDINKQIYVFDTVASTWVSPFATGSDVAPTRRREQ